MIQMRKDRLAIAAVILITSMIIVDLLVKYVATSAPQQKLLGDAVTAVMIASLAFVIPHVLRYLAGKQVSIESVIGSQRRDEIEHLMSKILGIRDRQRLPKLIVLDNEKCEASCVGVGSQATIFITKGLLTTLSDRSLLATVAHECGHIAGRHLLLQGLLFASIYFVGRTFVSLTPMHTPVFLAAYLSIAWQFEYYADRVSALHVGKSAMQVCCKELAAIRGKSIDDTTKTSLLDYISTHPSFAMRIARLEQFKD